MTILVTRPGWEGQALCRQIEEGGDCAFHFPTIAFAPPKNIDAFHQAIATLGEKDWLIFVSQQAVIASIPDIRKAWPQFPAHVQFAAVGASTAQALREAGYIALSPPDDWCSEGLLNLPAFQHIKGAKIAIVRGAGGREELEKVFLERGADVSHVIAYERVLPTVDASSYVEMLKQRQIDSVICASFEGVRNLKLLLGEAAWPYLQKVTLIVVSERIKTLAEDLGFQTIWVARNASHPAILATLMQLRNR